jgi:20S proteasome alpha/beta subunit
MILRGEFAQLLVPVEAAHSRRRPSVRTDSFQQAKYDRSITTFSEDGRLQQVEYSMEACNRGATVVAFKWNQTTAIVVVRDSSEKIHRIDQHVLLATSGLAGDGRALAGMLRSSCQRHRLSFGEPPTVEEVAKMAAQLQHDLTKAAGARPLGCSATVVGIDVLDSTSKGKVRLYQTEPGGILEECNFCAAGKFKSAMLEILDKNWPRRYSDGDHSLFDWNITLEVIAKLSNDGDKEASDICDVWIISPNAGKKSSARLICFKSNVTRDNIVFALP